MALSLEALVDADALGSLRRIAEAKAELERLEREQVVVAVDELGATWAQVGEALGRSASTTHRSYQGITRPQRRRRSVRAVGNNAH